MKQALNLIVLLLLFTHLGAGVMYAQNSFKDLERAQKLLEKGKYKRALQIVNKASIQNDCTCGICVIQKNYETNLLRYKIYTKLTDYSKALNALDSIYDPTAHIDSLKIAVYSLQLGKEKLKQIIQSGIASSKIECDSNTCFAFIRYETNQYLKFKLSFQLLSNYIYDPEKKVGNQVWNDYFLNSSAYKQLE